MGGWIGAGAGRGQGGRAGAEGPGARRRRGSEWMPAAAADGAGSSLRLFPAARPPQLLSAWAVAPLPPPAHPSPPVPTPSAAASRRHAFDQSLTFDQHVFDQKWPRAVTAQHGGSRRPPPAPLRGRPQPQRRQLLQARACGPFHHAASARPLARPGAAAATHRSESFRARRAAEQQPPAPGTPRAHGAAPGPCALAAARHAQAFLWADQSAFWHAAPQYRAPHLHEKPGRRCPHPAHASRPSSASTASARPARRLLCFCRTGAPEPAPRDVDERCSRESRDRSARELAVW